MRVGIWLLGVLAAPALAGDSPSRTAQTRGLAFPEVVLTWKLPHAKAGQPSEAATRTCRVFARYAVLSSDEGEMGVDDLVFRVRPAGIKPVDVCADAFRGGSVRPTGEASTCEPKGVHGRVLFSTWVDSFGLLTHFVLLDLDTGKTVYEDVYEEDRGIAFEGDGERPALTYWSQLKDFDCIPRRGETGCWNRIREKNGIPATVPQPDCEPAIAKDPSTLRGEVNRSFQITVHVRVARLSRNDAAYLPDRPDCELTP